MSDEKKDTTEEEVKETSEPIDEEVESGDASSDVSDASEGSDAEDSDVSDASDASDVSEVSDASEASEPGEEPPPAVATEKEVIVTEELDREDIETVDHIDRDDHDPNVLGIAAFFDHPDHLMYAAAQARDARYDDFDAYSPFPIHGMDDAMGLQRSWIPWVTFFAGGTGFLTACMIEFGIMGFDWPMVFGGKPAIAWPSFVPIMFELTVLLAGVTTALVMLIAAGCFRKPLIIDPEITNDRFVLWISANDPHFSAAQVVEFMRGLNPMEIRTLKKDADK